MSGELFGKLKKIIKKFLDIKFIKFKIILNKIKNYYYQIKLFKYK